MDLKMNTLRSQPEIHDFKRGRRPLNSIAEFEKNSKPRDLLKSSPKLKRQKSPLPPVNDFITEKRNQSMHQRIQSYRSDRSGQSMMESPIPVSQTPAPSYLRQKPIISEIDPEKELKRQQNLQWKFALEKQIEEKKNRLAEEKKRDEMEVKTYNSHYVHQTIRENHGTPMPNMKPTLVYTETQYHTPENKNEVTKIYGGIQSSKIPRPRRVVEFSTPLPISIEPRPPLQPKQKEPIRKTPIPLQKPTPAQNPVVVFQANVAVSRFEPAPPKGPPKSTSVRKQMAKTSSAPIPANKEHMPLTKSTESAIQPSKTIAYPEPSQPNITEPKQSKPLPPIEQNQRSSDVPTIGELNRSGKPITKIQSNGAKPYQVLQY
jgi:hypothetical protein